MCWLQELIHERTICVSSSLLQLSIKKTYCAVLILLNPCEYYTLCVDMTYHQHTLTELFQYHSFIAPKTCNAHIFDAHPSVEGVYGR